MPGLFSGGIVGGAKKVVDWLGDTQAPPDSIYGGQVDQGNFALPGADARGAYASGQMQGAQGRQAPQSAAAYSNAGGAFRNAQFGALDRLGRQMAGQESLSREQFRASTDAGAREQRSMAASANPNNAAMMARIASQNVGRMNQGFGAQAAMLGIQERNAAANALAGIAGQGRGQDMQQSQFNAGQRQQNAQFNVGAQLNQQGMNDHCGLGMGQLDLANAAAQRVRNMGYEQNQTSRYGIDKGVPAGPSNLERLAGVATKALPLFLGSDERMKTNVRQILPGEQARDAGALDRLGQSLTPHTYEYKDPANGPGERLGVMAQDVERAGPLGQSLVTEQQGTKMIDIPAALGTSLGLLGRLSERIAHLEGRRK
jgi:hypothetical protein